ATTKKYSTVNSESIFIVGGIGKILNINNKSQRGLIAVDIKPFDDKKDFVMQVGPVIKGTAIRDTLDTVDFNDFENQIQWSNLAEAYNSKSFEENFKDVSLKNNVIIEFNGIMIA